MYNTLTTSGFYQLVVKVRGNPAKEYKHEGKTYIEGRKGSNYSLFFRNNTLKRVLAIFSVDGLSVMDGKPASKDADGYLVDAMKEIEVPGWRIDSSKVAMFKFSPKGDRDQTYVEQLASEGFNVDIDNQGVIGCMVYEEKPYVPQYQYNYPIHQLYGWHNLNIYPNLNVYPCSSIENTFYDGHSVNVSYSSGELVPTNMCVTASQETLGTGFGEDKKFETVDVSFEKNSYAAWTGVIYYDTLLNLKKKGVIVERKEPEAFPGSNGCYVPRRRA